MICLIALVIFSVLAIFSVRYRPLTKEAYNCVFRRVTFRKCKTNLNVRLKSTITAKVMKHSPRLGSTVYRHFEVLSWLFLIIMVVSLFYAADGIYNYAKYGNCYGENAEGQCLYAEMAGAETSCTQPECEEACTCETAECQSECESCLGQG